MSTSYTLESPPPRRDSLDYSNHPYAQTYHANRNQSLADLPFSPAQNLPETVNTLHQSEKARRMRSTRKLGALLGETPFLLDESAVLSKAKKTKRHGSIFEHPGVVASQSTLSLHNVTSIDSVESDNGTSPTQIAQRRQKPGPKPLLLRLQPTSAQNIVSPTISTDSRTSSESHAATPRAGLPMRTPTTADIHSWKGGRNIQRKKSSSTITRKKSYTLVRCPSASYLAAQAYASEEEGLATPLSATFTISPPKVDLKDQRRRKMAKLMRTLGEVVPAELVFPEARSSSESNSSTSSFSSGWATDYSWQAAANESDEETPSPNNVAPSKADLRAGDRRQDLDPCDTAPTKGHLRRPTHSFTDRQRDLFNSLPRAEDVPALPQTARKQTLSKPTREMRGGLPSSPRNRNSKVDPDLSNIPTFTREQTGDPMGPRTSYMRGASFSGPSAPVKDHSSSESSEWASTDIEEESDVPELKIMARSHTTFSDFAVNSEWRPSAEKKHHRVVAPTHVQEWEGEWNIRDMKDVVKALRNLRR